MIIVIIPLLIFIIPEVKSFVRLRPSITSTSLGLKGVPVINLQTTLAGVSVSPSLNFAPVLVTKVNHFDLFQATIRGFEKLTIVALASQVLVFVA